MVCPGGWINGGGQPVQSDSVRNYVDLKSLSSAVLYDSDKRTTCVAHTTAPLSLCSTTSTSRPPGKAKAHSLLHTTYTPRPVP